MLRTRQYNFFLATFAASAAIQQSLIQFSSLTGGTNGIAFILRPSSFLGLSFEGNIGFFVLVFILTVAVTIALLTLDRSQFGRTIRAVAMNEQPVGIPWNLQSGAIELWHSSRAQQSQALPASCWEISTR
ncbi:hypothetical protein [Rhizobium sp. AN63]|uniref:ABC transporter permease subunit n=1 Tax=Rhizobium sp. AN63 TaxID=3035210 RepID=UPI0035A098CC